MLVLDSGAVTKLAKRTIQNSAYIATLLHDGAWPPVVPTVVLVESLTGRAGPDANVNRLLATCTIVTKISEVTARRAARLRLLARRGSAVDAMVVALAEPSGTVLTGDAEDLRALVAHSAGVVIETI